MQQASMAQLENHTHQMEQESELEIVVELPSAPDLDRPLEEEQTSIDLSSLATQMPIHEGTVFKVGGKGGLERVQKRYFVLYEGVVVYYHHHTNYIRDKKDGLVSKIYTCTCIHAPAWLCSWEAVFKQRPFICTECVHHVCVL